MGLIPYDQAQPGFDAVAMWTTDAIRFIDVFGEPISQSMPHIYLSALAFAPWTSIIPQHYASLYPSIGILKANQRSSWLDVQPILQDTLTTSTPSHSRQMVHGSLRAQLTRHFGCGM